VFLGTVVGVLPASGRPRPSDAAAAHFQHEPLRGDHHARGIYYGAKYGGSTTSILMNVPGESASVVTCIDGYQMARKGRAGAALGIAAIASFVAGPSSAGLMLVHRRSRNSRFRSARRSISR